MITVTDLCLCVYQIMQGIHGCGSIITLYPGFFAFRFAVRLIPANPQHSGRGCHTFARAWRCQLDQRNQHQKVEPAETGISFKGSISLKPSKRWKQKMCDDSSMHLVCMWNFDGSTSRCNLRSVFLPFLHRLYRTYRVSQPAALSAWSTGWWKHTYQ